MARTNIPKPQTNNQSKKPSGPFGGWMKNPPEDCKYRSKDNKGIWVETVICAFTCKHGNHCKCYVELMKDSKKRIRGE